AGAEQRGFRIHGSVVEELEQRCPFGAIADCLGIDPSARGEGRDEVARLLYGQAPSLASSVFLADSSAMEYQVHDRLLALVERRCSPRPLAMAIENLQWADPSTLLFLHRLARHADQLPLLLLLTSRPLPRHRDLAQLVHSLEQRGGAERLAL